MNTHRLAAPALALALLAGPSAGIAPAFAADTSANPVAQATTPMAGTTSDAAYKVSEDAFTAMREVRAARLAIFNGDTELATKLVSNAKTKIDGADTAAMKLDHAPSGHPAAGGSKAVGSMASGGDTAKAGAGTTTATAATTPGSTTTPPATTAATTGGSGTQTSANASGIGTPAMDPDARYIPIDAELIVGGIETVTPQNAPLVQKANEHLKAGDKEAAKDKFKLAELVVMMIWAMVPADATMKAIDQANDLVGQSKWYEANLALKSAEDGMVFDAVDIMGVPKPAGQRGAAMNKTASAPASASAAAKPKAQ